MKNYANAKDVLPKELFLEIRKHCTGGMLYVPKGNNSEDRKKLVIALANQKTPAREIALLSGLTMRRVHQVIAQERRKNAFSGCAKE